MQRSAVWAAAVAATEEAQDGGTAGDAGTDPVTPPDRSTLVSDLSEGEKAALCQQIVQAQGAEEVQCDGFTVTPPTFEECLADVPAGGTCTVGMVQDCMDSLGGNACNIFSTTECAALFEC